MLNNRTWGTKTRQWHYQQLTGKAPTGVGETQSDGSFCFGGAFLTFKAWQQMVILFEFEKFVMEESILSSYFKKHLYHFQKCNMVALF